MPEFPRIPISSYAVLVYAVVALLILIFYGIIGSMFLMDLDPVSAFYFTIITVATIGYGDIIPVTSIQKLFVVTLVLGGVGILAYTFGLIITVVTMAIEEITTGAKVKRMISKAKNHFVLCGHGRVGSAVFKELRKRNHKAIIIEKNRKIVETLWEDPEILAIPGDATDEKLLLDAGIKRARGIIITTGDDADNLFITLTAKDLNPDIWAVVRVGKSENVKRLQHAGADRVILPEVSGGEDIYFAAIEPTMMKITEKHDVENIIEDIRKETEIILKHGCTLENIEYHLPEFREPLKRKIEISKIEELNRFLSSLKRDIAKKMSLERIYESASGIHSHWISGPDKESLNMVADDLKKEGFLLGFNLSDKEIREIVKKYGRTIEIVIKPEIKVTETHMVEDIREETEIILGHGCTIEDIEYYPPEFKEPLHRKIGVSKTEKMERFLDSLERDHAKKESLDRLYALSGGIHSHRISGPSTKSLREVERDLRKKGFLLGVNLSDKEIKDVIKEYSGVVEITVKHGVEELDDKRIIIMTGGRILGSNHYLPGVRQVVTRKMYLRSPEDLKKCEEELKRLDARRSLEALYKTSKYVHSHRVFAPDVKTIKKIEKELSEKGILVGVNMPEEEIWRMVEK